MDILLKERLVSYYEKHILEDVMPFWDRRCIDKEYGHMVPVYGFTTIIQILLVLTEKER